MGVVACMHSFIRQYSWRSFVVMCLLVMELCIYRLQEREGASLLLGGVRTQVLDLDPGWSPTSAVVYIWDLLHK